MAATGTENYEERIGRFEEAIALGTPDRVPFFPIIQLMPRKYAGINAKQAFYDSGTWMEASKKAILDLEPDIDWADSAVYQGRALEAARIRQLKWPGPGGPPKDSGIQFVEDEYNV